MTYPTQVSAHIVATLAGAAGLLATLVLVVFTVGSQANASPEFIASAK